MTQYFQRLSIFQRLFFAFCLAAIVPGVIILLFCGIYNSILSSYNNAQHINIALLAEARSLEKNVAAAHVLVNDFAIERPSITSTRRTEYQNKFAVLNSQIEDQIKQFNSKYNLKNGSRILPLSTLLAVQTGQTQENYIISEQSDALLALQSTTGDRSQWKDYANAANLLLTATDANAQYADLLSDVNGKYATLYPNVRTLTTSAVEMQTIVAQYGLNPTVQVFVWTAIALILFMIGIFTIGYAISRAVIEPFQQLEIWTRRIAKGDLHIRAPRMGLDEIDTVAQSMNDMLDRTARLREETHKQHELLQGQIEQLLSEVDAIGDGDLRPRATVNADNIGVLSQSFNYMIEELSNLIVRVKIVALEVDGLKNVVLERMMRLVSTNSVQMNRMGMAAVEVERMAQLSRQVADRALLLHQMSTTARENAQMGRKAIQGLIGGMERISQNVEGTVNHVEQLNQRSIEIADSVKVISSMVHQTNKLALDASIQAAMAGKEGQGFGAVAADIRRLAERASERASTVVGTAQRVREDIEIASQSVFAMDSEVKQDLPLTRNAGVALESIFAAIEREAREIEHITAMSAQQLQSASTIVAIFNGMAQVTRQNSQTMQQMSGETRKLAPLVEQLRTSVEAFQLQEDANLASNALKLGYSQPRVPVLQFSPAQIPNRATLIRQPGNGKSPEFRN